MANNEENPKRGWLWFTVAILVLLVAYFAYRSTHGVVEVRLATADRQNITLTVSTNGKVYPSDDFQAHAPMPGIVEKLYVDLGQQVSRGQLLVAMDESDARKNVASAEASLRSAESATQNMKAGGTQDELLSEKADMKAAEAQLQQTTSALTSMQLLQGKGAASANEVTQARQRQSDAQARINALNARRSNRYNASEVAAQRAQLQQAQSGLAAAQSGFAGVSVRAPFAGTVYDIPVAEYDFVQAGEALLNVADLTKLEIRAYFDEPDTGKLAKGQPVSIVWAAKPNLTWHGHILEAPTSIKEYHSTRNVGECLISVEDARGDLLPNTNVTVNVRTLSKPNVLTIPHEALRTNGNSSFVYKLVGEKLVKTSVQVGAVNNTLVEVISGLSQGDTVALGATDQTELTDGLRVKARN